MHKITGFFWLLFFPTSTIANDGIIAQMSASMNVSRLEFVLFKIEQELTEEFRHSYELQSFNDVYSVPSHVKYKVSSYVAKNKIYVHLALNDTIICGDQKLTITEDFLPKMIRLKMDNLAVELMSYFHHTGEYEDLNIYGQNMVHSRLAEIFSSDPIGSTRVQEDQLSYASELGKKINIAVSVEFCEPSKLFFKKDYLTRVYSLNSDYTWTTADFKRFSNVEER